MNPNLLYLLPVLMFTMQYLVILQHNKRKEIFSQHYDFDTISLLSPLAAEQITKGRISKRYLIKIVILTILLTFVATTFDPESLFENRALEFFLGLALTMFTAAIVRLVGNLALYHYLAKNPQEISGKIHLKTPIVMLQLIMEYTMLLAVIGIWVSLSPSIFGYGALTGILSIITHLIWYFYKSKRIQKTIVS